MKSDSEIMFLLIFLPAMKQLSAVLNRNPSTKTEAFFSSRIVGDNIPKHVIIFPFSII
jgi:hypothetical protein